MREARPLMSSEWHRGKQSQNIYRKSNFSSSDYIVLPELVTIVSQAVTVPQNQESASGRLEDVSSNHQESKSRLHLGPPQKALGALEGRPENS